MTLLLATVLLLAGCRHARKEQPALPAPSDTVAPPATVDSTPSVLPDSSGRPPRGFQLSQDTLPPTDWRLFAPRQKVIYDPKLLVGEWTNGTEHELYMADGTGTRWDDAEDVYREEAQQFRWTMDSNRLNLMFHLALGAVVPRQYLVTFADDENLVYKDAYGFSYMWDKVPAGFSDHPSLLAPAE